MDESAGMNKDKLGRAFHGRVALAMRGLLCTVESFHKQCFIAK